MIRLVLTAFLAACLLIPLQVGAQQVVRLYGTLSGAPIALAADSSGRLRVALESMAAGGGTATYIPGGAIYTAFPNTTNGANTNYACAEFPAIPANTLSTNGDALHVEYLLTGSSASSSKTYQLNFGYTACDDDATGFTGGTLVLNNSTTVASADYSGEAFIVRTGASAQLAWSHTLVTAADQNTASTTPNAATTGAINIGMAVRDGSSNAASITLKWVRISYLPAPPS